MSLSMLKVLFLAFIQGVSEFLPVSSSGHLALFNSLFNFDSETSLTLTVALHAGTLLTIVIFYFKEIMQLFINKNWRLFFLLVVASIPTGIMGALLATFKLEDKMFNNLFVCAIGFFVTASLLKRTSSKSIKQAKDNKTASLKDLSNISYLQAIKIGIAQAIAVVPGISRSGSTIAVALKLGIRPVNALRFSFFMAIPAIGGAVGYKFLKALLSAKIKIGTLLPAELAIGFIVSATIGYLALSLLKNIMEKGKLTIFVNYLYIVSVIALVAAISNYL